MILVRKLCKKRKRVGRGNASGNGNTCGRGNKGQRSRSGYKNMRSFSTKYINFFRRIKKITFRKHSCSRKINFILHGSFISTSILMKLLFDMFHFKCFLYNIQACRKAKKIIESFGGNIFYVKKNKSYRCCCKEFT